MRPTFSIIAFTVLSGAGYGLLCLLGIVLALGGAMPSPYPVSLDSANADAVALIARIADPLAALRWPLVIGTLLVSFGLVASVGHLGKPLRAWRAFSQWRSSWLSREGVVAVATYVPIFLIAGWLFGVLPARHAQAGLRWSGSALALLCVVTVYCTANIYASLKPIRAWHNAFVAPVYIALALTSGLLWLIASGGPAVASLVHARPGQYGVTIGTLCVLAVAGTLLKLAYWRWLDRSPRTPDAGIATGLAHLGKVSSFEAPHTEDNYLTHEMGFALARKHSRRLRMIAVASAFLLPVVLVAIGSIAVTVRMPLAWLAVVLGMLGVFVERWLFFAEARHAVIAYYGR